MNQPTRRIFWTLAILLVLAAGYVMKFGLYPRYFDIEWDEEVQLHDGRMILVHVKNTYERQSALRLKQHDENSIQFRKTYRTFELDTGKKVTFTTRMPIVYLGKFEDKWYAVIYGQGPYGNYPDEMPDHWGNDYSPSIMRLAILKDDVFKPARWADAPEPLKTLRLKGNVMTSIFWSELPAWNEKRITVDQKNSLMTSTRNLAD